MTDDPVTRIVRRDPRYARAGYDFVRHALRVAVDQEQPEHVSARELLESIRKMARAQFGPLARTVLHDWGVHSTADFGEMVFNLIDEKELGKTDDDRISDFADVFDFDTAFPAETGEARVHRAADEWDVFEEEEGADDDEDEEEDEEEEED